TLVRLFTARTSGCRRSAPAFATNGSAPPSRSRLSFVSFSKRTFLPTRALLILYATVEAAEFSTALDTPVLPLDLHLVEISKVAASSTGHVRCLLTAHRYFESANAQTRTRRNAHVRSDRHRHPNAPGTTQRR